MKKLFATIRAILGRGMTQAEVDAINASMKPDAARKLSDATAFFGQVRGITGPLGQDQVDSITAILAAVPSWPVSWVAYALATAWHESKLRPISEMGGNAYLSKYDTGALAKILGNTPERDGDGQLYAGRGFVQLTGRTNYRNAGAMLGLDLIAQPNLALKTENAARILAWGMEGGKFTGKALRNYLPNEIGSEAQFTAARRIINGTDKAALIAGYAVRFQSALKAGAWA